MEPATLFLILGVLACPIGMGLMMWLMNKNMGGRFSHAVSGYQAPVKPAERLATLHAQRQQLEDEIAETARIAGLEARRELLQANQRHYAGPTGVSVAPRAD